MKKLTRSQEKALARAALDAAARVLRTHEQAWMTEYRAITCPFEQVEWYLSAEQRARRKPITEKWVAAKEHFSEFESAQDEEETA